MFLFLESEIFMLKNIIVTLCLIFLIVSILGCKFSREKPVGFPDHLFSCKLTFTQAGVPLSGALVQLIPIDNNIEKNWSAGGRTDAKGVANIFTYGKWEGAPPGTFKVTVKKQIEEEINGKTNFYALVSEKFTEPETTPLSLEITGKTTQLFEIGTAIKKKVRN
jgi:hypothetical protein